MLPALPEPTSSESSASPEPLDAETRAVRTAAWALAKYFDGVVLDAQGNRVPHPKPASPATKEQLTLPEDRSSDSIGSKAVQLELFAVSPQTTAIPISLQALREWYEIAQDLGRSPQQLQRIVVLGNQFKQQFGEEQPEITHLFGRWDEYDVEQWRRDLDWDEFKQQK